MSAYMQKIKVRCQFIKGILGIKEYLNLIGQEHDHAQACFPKIDRLYLSFWFMFIYMQNVRVTIQFIQEILMIKE